MINTEHLLAKQNPLLKMIFNDFRLSSIPTPITNYTHEKCEITLFVHSHTSQGLLILIHGGIKVQPC